MTEEKEIIQPEKEIVQPTPATEPPPEMVNGAIQELSVGETLEILHGAVGMFIHVVTRERDRELAAAKERAGGDVYKVEAHGFEPHKFDIISNAQAFLKALRELK